MKCKNFDLNNYYIGFIQLNPFVYNKDNSTRLLNGINYDPFAEVDTMTGMIKGEIVLLRKEKNTFYDEYSSRYKNEVKYHLGETNKLGIKLSYIKPFQEIYRDDPKIFIKEELENNSRLLEFLYEDYEYYISYSKLDKTYAIIILNDEISNIVRDEYYIKNFQDSVKQYTKNKKEN